MINLAVYAEVLSRIDPGVFKNLSDSSIPEQQTLWQQLSSSNTAVGHGNSCKCTRSHAYRSCIRVIEHLWTWIGEAATKDDFCTCPPTDERLLALECPKLALHIKVYPLL